MAAWLSEMLREAERGVDPQLKVLEEMDDKSEQLLAGSLGALGAGLALLAFATDQLPGRVDPAFKTLLGITVMANLCGIISFLAGYVAARLGGALRRSLSRAAEGKGEPRGLANGRASPRAHRELRRLFRAQRRAAGQPPSRPPNGAPYPQRRTSEKGDRA